MLYVDYIKSKIFFNYLYIIWSSNKRSLMEYWNS